MLLYYTEVQGRLASWPQVDEAKMSIPPILRIQRATISTDNDV